MHTRHRSDQGVIVTPCVAVVALFALTGTLGPVSYAAVATVLLALTVIVKMAYAKRHETATLASS